MKKILVINLGWEQEPLLDKLMEYDVEIYGVHYNENYYQKPNYRDVLVTDIRDLEKILSYAKNIDIDAVICRARAKGCSSPIVVYVPGKNERWL